MVGSMEDPANIFTVILFLSDFYDKRYTNTDYKWFIKVENIVSKAKGVARVG